MYKILYRYQYQQLVHQILQLTDSIVSKNNKLVQLFEIDVFGFGSTCHVRIIHVHLHECIFEEKTAGQLTCTHGTGTQFNVYILVHVFRKRRKSSKLVLFGHRNQPRRSYPMPSNTFTGQKVRYMYMAHITKFQYFQYTT